MYVVVLFFECWLFMDKFNLVFLGLYLVFNFFCRCFCLVKMLGIGFFCKWLLFEVNCLFISINLVEYLVIRYLEFIFFLIVFYFLFFLVLEAVGNLLNIKIFNK